MLSVTIRFSTRLTAAAKRKQGNKMNKWIWQLIGLVLSQASPVIREHLCKLLIDLEAKAKETPNKWDDVLVGLLQTVLNCPEK